MTRDHSPDSAADACGAAVESGCGRRSLLRGAVALGAVGIGGALTGCGGGSSSDAALTSAQGSTPITGTGAAAAPASAAKKPASGVRKKGVSLGSASKVPVGGGVIYDAARVVVTQPTAGVYKAFDATCTHEKCLLADVAEGTINCACHGGKFSITDGSAVQFPAVEPLPARKVKVAGGKLSVT